MTGGTRLGFGDKAMTRVWRWPLGFLFAAGLAMALTGCGAKLREERLEREERLNVYPGTYRADVAAAMRSYVSDPASIRDAWIAEPAIAQVGLQRRYAACVRFSARNSDGRYAARNALAVFSSGRFDQFVEASASTDPASQESLSTLMKGLCEAAEYKRFPELEAMKR
jgi:hypothetical protein